MSGSSESEPNLNRRIGQGQLVWQYIGDDIDESIYQSTYRWYIFTYH